MTVESFDVCDEVVAILIPFPTREGLDGDAYSRAVATAHEQRVALADDLRRFLRDDEQDPLLHVVRETRQRIEDAQADLRRLLAYARRFTRPRPYPLRDLGQAGGMSASSVRTAYGPVDVESVAQLLGRSPVPHSNADD
jgi:hypothetical protein